jgi:hypothetical protein
MQLNCGPVVRDSDQPEDRIMCEIIDLNIIVVSKVMDTWNVRITAVADALTFHLKPKESC